MRSYSFFLLSCFLVGCLSLTSGCENRDLLTEDLLDSQMASMKIDDLNRTLDFVFSDSRFDQKEFEEKIATGFNRWSNEVINDGQGEDNWEPDPLVSELVESTRQGINSGSVTAASTPVLDRIDEISYLNSDGYYVQQAAWLKKIGERVLSSPKLATFEMYRLAAGNEEGEDTLESFNQIVNKLHPDLSGDEAKKLADGIRLFDWVARNIQLTSSEGLTDEKTEEYRLNDLTDPASAGIPGLGYSHFPWQTLVYGRGDYVERAKLFLLMGQQVGLDVVMLAVPNEEGVKTPWLPALVVGNGKVYLFDPYLGIAFPGESNGSVATLDEVRKSEKLLTGLDLSLEESTRDNTKYPVRPEQIKDVSALVYVSPEAVSRRMKFLEDRLVGDSRLKLYVQATEEVARVKQETGLETAIWDIGFQTQRFRTVVKDAIAEAAFDSNIASKLSWYYRNESYVDQFVRYRTARNLYFIGKFESERNSRRLNAIEMFYSLMYTDENISGLATNKSLLYRLGIRKDEKQTVKEFNERLRGVQNQMELVRRDAGLFLAQSIFDSGNIGTSANWLKRVEDKGISERWNTGIDYLTARAFEATKEYDRAIERYAKGQHDQFHGNLIRARILREAQKNLKGS